MKIEQIVAGKTRAISKALSLVENGDFAAVQGLLKPLHAQAGDTFVIGVTGSPGAGKSTLVEQMAKQFLEGSEKVGILAVDPTSPFSGGALLGDRIRMQDLATHTDVFIRSMATRGKLGGLSSAVNDALIVLGAAGFRKILVETVGVGQDEIDIVKTADVTCVVLVPGMGDDIQAIKAGIMEIGDVFVINKADHHGVEKTRREVEALLSLADRDKGWEPPVVETVACTGKGVPELMSVLEECRKHVFEPRNWTKRRQLFHQYRLIDLLRDRLLDELVEAAGAEQLEQLTQQVAERQLDPYSAVEILYKRLRLA